MATTYSLVSVRRQPAALSQFGEIGNKGNGPIQPSLMKATTNLL